MPKHLQYELRFASLFVLFVANRTLEDPFLAVICIHYMYVLHAGFRQRTEHGAAPATNRAEIDQYICTVRRLSIEERCSRS